jgi:hypothetical protein
MILGNIRNYNPKMQNNTAEDLNIQTQHYCHFPKLKILAKFENSPELNEEPRASEVVSHKRKIQCPCRELSTSFVF